MNKRIGVRILGIVLLCSYGIWWKWIRDPHATDPAWFHPEEFVISADIEGKDVPSTIDFNE